MNTLFLSSAKRPKTIYTNEAELVSGTTLVLDETKQEYLLQLYATQALSIDTTQLSNKCEQFNMTFYLTIVSEGHYVINFADCNVLQMEFYKGSSRLKFSRVPSSDTWTIDILEYSGIAPSVSVVGMKYRREFCLSPISTKNLTNSLLFEEYSNMGAANSDNKRLTLIGSDVDYYTYSLNQFILTRVSIHVYTATTYTYPPSQMQIYGSDDLQNWTLLYSNNDLALTSHYGEVLYYTPNIIRPYKCFKFHFTSAGPYVALAPMSMEGIGAELLYAGAMLGFPAIGSAINDYEVTVNTGDGVACTNSTTPYGAVLETGLQMSRPDTSTPWKITYTYPEAVRPMGFALQRWGNNRYTCPDWYAWYGSDDGTNWTKAIEFRRVFPLFDSPDDTIIHYPVDFGAAHKYWQFIIYACYDATRTNVNLKTLRPLTKDYQYYLFESVVPKLSADEQDPFVVSASNITTGNNAYHMYDRDNNTWCQGQISDGQWTTTIDMGSPVIIQGLQIMSGGTNWNQAPTTFKVQGKVSGGSWTDIAYYTLGTDYWSSRENHLGSFEFDNDTGYQYYRLLVTATAQGSYVGIVFLGWTTELRTNPINYYTDEYLVPVMTADSQDGYIASASSYSNNRNPYHAFDRNTEAAYKWITLSGQPINGSWIKIELPTATAVTVFGIQAPNESGYTSRVPTVFKIQGSNDNSTWTDLVDVSGISWSGNELKTWNNTAPSTVYKYYKIAITANGGDSTYVAIGAWYLIRRTYYNN